MTKYKLYQVDAFTTKQFNGNPAGVVSNANGLTDIQMQAIARELNNSETAFIFSSTAQDHDLRIRFFTPITEVPTCGHATVSAHYVRAIENNLPTCRVIQQIGIGKLPVDIVRKNDDYKIIMTQGRIKFSEILIGNSRAHLLSALGLEDSDVNERCPIQVVSTGHSKVLIGIKSREKLNKLKPDLLLLSEMSSRIKCNGYFVFTLDSRSKDILTHGRMFAPVIGIPEDPVTGNANGPLGAYLAKHKIVEFSNDILAFKGKQGEAMGRPGIIDVKVIMKTGIPQVVTIGGHATIVFKTEITV